MFRDLSHRRRSNMPLAALSFLCCVGRCVSAYAEAATPKVFLGWQVPPAAGRLLLSRRQRHLQLTQRCTHALAQRVSMHINRQVTSASSLTDNLGSYQYMQYLHSPWSPSSCRDTAKDIAWRLLCHECFEVPSGVAINFSPPPFVMCS